MNARPLMLAIITAVLAIIVVAFLCVCWGVAWFGRAVATLMTEWRR